MNQNDENLSELKLKSFWYKSDKKAFVQKWIWLYLSQFLTVFDEPKTQLKEVNVATKVCNTVTVKPVVTHSNWFFTGFKILLKLSNQLPE